MADLVRNPNQEPERFHESEDLKIGTWVWVLEEQEKEEEQQLDRKKWLGCIMHVGTNYVLVQQPHSDHQGYSHRRIHFDDIPTSLEVEPDPQKVIFGRVEHYKSEVRSLIDKARNLLETLGLSAYMLPAPAEVQSRALVLASKAPSVKKYKNQLVKAKEKTLPDIFKQIEQSNAGLARWMSAQAMPLRAGADQAQKAVGGIQDRVFTIELYAGLLEQVKLVKKGKAAGLDQKLHVMQRRCYMDEECLLGYRSGGIEFKNIKDFDKWLSKKENFERILPFPRCMVAFRVRRRVKEREWDGSFAGAFIQIRLEQADKYTFLYIRNGKRLYRLDTEIEFGSEIFPDRDEFVLDEKMWAGMFGGNVQEVISDHEYQGALEEVRERKREKRQKSKEWKRKHPGKRGNPYYDEEWDIDSLNNFEPYNPTSVYYDDIHEKIGNDIKEFNRIAVIIQGLFDRSKVLHPHPRVHLWTPEGFEEAVELVYDSDHVLYATAEPPDFEAYLAKCNESLKWGSVTVGQDDFWQRKEAEKYNRQYGWQRHHYNHTHYSPYGNPGPGFLARIDRWAPRVRKATYRWERKRQTPRYKWYYGRKDGPIQTGITVPADKLFNVDAYKPGDFKQFYVDPRTRANYLKWAEMLLAAEEYHAGNLKVDADKRVKED